MSLLYDLGTPSEAVVTIPANDLTVTNVNDSGEGSLRQAMLNANSFSSDDTIVFSSLFSSAQTITLTSGELPIADNGTLIIPGGGTVTVDGGGSTYRVFNVATGANVTFDDLTISNGHTSGDGGAITADNATVSVSNSTLTGSYAGGRGGAIYLNDGSLTLTNSNVSSNTGAAYGGGIYNNGGTATLSDCTLDANHSPGATGPTGSGGAIFSASGTVGLTNCTVSNNVSRTFAGGIYNKGGTATVTNSTFSGNSSTTNAGGGIYNSGGKMTVTQSTFSENSAVDGGGINNVSGGTLIVNESTFSGNTTTNDGGGILNGYIATVINSTFSDNMAGLYGGGLVAVNGNTVTTITNSTFSGNSAASGGGVYANLGGVDVTLNLNNSILADNTGGDCDPGAGTINAQNSLIKDGLTCVNGTNVSNLTGIDPSLGALTGSPAYYPLNSDSPAIDAGDDNLAKDGDGNTLLTDEAGNTRVQGFAVDMGAFESSYALAAPVITTDPQSQTIFSGQTADLSVVATGNLLTYKWYEGISGDTSTPVGTDSPNFTTLALSADTSYWVRVSNLAGSVDSATATVTVLPAPSITTQPQSTAIITGQSTTLAVVASGTSLSYHWYEGTSGNTSTSVGTDSPNFTTPALFADTSYWVQVSNPAGSIDSTTAAVTVSPNFVVDTNSDADIEVCSTAPNDCSLRGAINLANTFAGADTITFADDYTITLAGSSLPDVTTEMTISGTGAANTIVQASTCNPVTLPGGCTPATYRVFNVTSSGNLTLANLTAQYGAAGSEYGGGVYSDGTLTVIGSIISGNSANYGGGIYSYYDTLLTVTDSTVSGNSAASHGGGIYTGDGATLTVTHSTVSGNSAATNGGGILSTGTLTVIGSTLSGNSAKYGGGLFDDGTQPGWVINSTFSGNSAATFGSGIYNTGSTLTVTNSTLSGNTSGVFSGSLYIYGVLNLNNSIVANSSIGYCSHQGSGIINARNSLIEGGLICVNGTNLNNLTDSPSLGALTGSPAYFPLNSDSPVIDAGDNTLVPVGLTTDEAGNARIQGGTVDMGAYEFGLSASSGQRDQSSN